MIDRMDGNSPLLMAASTRLLILGVALVLLWLAVAWAIQ